MVQRMGNLSTIDAWEREEGAPTPVGATWVQELGAWNFSIYSRAATGVTLLIYGTDDLRVPLLALELDPLVNKTGRIWHCLVSTARVPGAAYYAYQVDGPSGGAHAFVPAKVLTDPFARRLFFPPTFSREAACGPDANDGRAVLAVLPTAAWAQEPIPAGGPRHTHDMVIYELHVKGFTGRENSGVAADRRGTFRGVIDKIDHLVDLGVTVVELLPVHQFDPQEGNYWGYMTMNFFAPHHEYAATDAVVEFREMVDALHAAGIEVWLDVVYNHTAEGDRSGPNYNLAGIDNDSYYIVAPDGSYLNDTGCGNTTQAADVATRALVLRSLAHWSEQMGVDGYRFDLASILTRDLDGAVERDAPPMISEISLLAGTHDVRVTAEAWDLGAYQLGQGFPGIMWRQWNGRFRDDVRGFVKGDDGLVPALMSRVYGSADLFPDGPNDMYRPYQSVNFVTAHDGFCLYDLVAYNDRHNLANGHGGTDGASDNLSWNCGWEGDDGAPQAVLDLRMRQMKNFAALMMLSNGVPMIVAGDEFANTQGGNNNPYNQDNETTWLDWDRMHSHGDLYSFFRAMIALRRTRKAVSRSRFWRGVVHWYGAEGDPDTSNTSHSVAWHLSGASHGEGDLYAIVNAYHEPVEFTIQAPGDWRRIVDTSLTAPDHVLPFDAAPPVGLGVMVAARSIIVLST